MAWSLWVAAIGCCVGGLVVTLMLTRSLTVGVLVDGTAKALAYPLGYATVGLVLTLRLPANPIGWLYAAAGLVWSLSIPWDPWLIQLIHEDRPLPPAARVAAVYGEFHWAPATVLGIALPALLVPDGRLRSRRWRTVAAGAGAGAGLVLIGGSLAPVQLEDLSIINPSGLTGRAGAVAVAVFVAGTVVWAVSMVASVACVVVRFRHARGTERQQLFWVSAGAVGAVAGLLAGVLAPQGTAVSAVLYATVLCVPVAVAVAVLRYRLWDLDRLVSRTVTYAVVTTLLVLPYLLIVPTAGRVTQGSGDLTVAAVTLAAALAFNPLRRRIQDMVDRHFSRARYDAVRAVEAFAARLRVHVDLDAQTAELLAAVDETVRPTRVQLWLRPLRRQNLRPTSHDAVT